VYEAAQAGDPFAREAWSDAVRYLTVALANYVTLVNPRVLVLGGGVIETVPALFESLAVGVPAATSSFEMMSSSPDAPTHSLTGVVKWTGVTPIVPPACSTHFCWIVSAPE